MSDRQGDNKRDELDRDELKRHIVAALQRRRDRRPGEAPKPLPAIAIARCFGIRPRGGRDSRKRGVRILIRELREADGYAILPCDGGYYLGQDLADYQRAEQFARRSGLSDLALGAAIRHHPEHADAQGQMGLFAGARR